MKKRFLSAFLVFAMILTLVPAMSFTASAEEEANVSISVAAKDSINDSRYNEIFCHSIQEVNDAIVKIRQEWPDSYCAVYIRFSSVIDAPIVLPAGGNYHFEGTGERVSTTGKPRCIVRNYGNTVMSNVNFVNTDSRNNSGGYCIENFGTLRLTKDNSMSGAYYGIINDRGASLYIEDNYYSTNISGIWEAISNYGYLKMTKGNLAKSLISEEVSLSNYGTADIYGGTIAGNVKNYSTLNIYGGTVAGNVINTGTLNIYGGKISGNVADGTSSAASEALALNLLGGEIEGNVTSSGTAEISGGKIGGKLINNGEMTVYYGLTGGIENNNGTLKDLLGENAYYYTGNYIAIDVGSASSYEGEIGVTLSGLSLLTEPDGTKHFLRDEEIIPYLNEHQNTSGVLEFRNGAVINNTDDNIFLNVKDLTMRGNATISSVGTWLITNKGLVTIDGLTLISTGIDGPNEFSPAAVVYNYGTLVIINSTLKGYTKGDFIDCPVENRGTIRISNSTIDGTLHDWNGSPLSEWLGACQRFVNSKGETVDLSAVTQYSGSLKVVDDPDAHEWTEATCQFPATCTKCGMTKGELAPHAEYYPATCTEPMICKACGAEVGNPLGHDYDALYVVKEATETTPAEYHAVCTRCGDVTDDYIPKTALDSATLTGIKAGDFLKRGATFKNNYPSVFPLYDCDIYVNGVKEVDLHKSKEWTAPECLLCTKVEKGTSSGKVHFVSACDFTEATCTEPATCVYCGEADGEAPGHTWEGATCTEPAVCTECGAIGEALGHDFSKPGTLISAADCTHSAVYTAKCVRCEETNGTLQVGSPLGHKYELIKKLSDSPLTYTAECLVCGEYNEAYEVPEKHYVVTETKTTLSLQVGDTVKPNSVISLDPISKTIGKKITVYIDGIKVYEDKNDYTTPNQCLKCVQKSGTTLRFETDCLFIRVNCENPKTCVYCGHTVGSALGHNFENGVCTECGYTHFAFDSVSLVLSGELGLNFYTVINDAEAVKDGYMLFEIGNKGVTQTVYLGDAVLVGERYVFRCNVNALQMSDTITVSFHYGDVTVGPKTTSVASYIDKVIEKHGNNDTDPTVKLAKSILNYGHYAQLALSELHGFTLGTDYTVTDNKSDVTIADASDLEAYKATKTGSIDGIAKVSRSLSLNHGTDINLYLTVAEAYEPTVNVTDKNGNTVDFTLEKTGSRYLLIIPQIAAHELGDMYTVSIDSGAMTIGISALSYAYSVLSSEKTDAQKLCVSALYEYYIAAIEYQNGGHDYGELIPTKDSTCTETGLITHYHCSICGKVFDESKNETTLQDLVIEAKGHTFATYFFNKTEHWQECTVCGAPTEREPHNYNDNHDGTATCTKCDAKGGIFNISGTTLDGLTDIGKTLPKIVIPEGVTEIGFDVFKKSYVAVEELVIPDNVTTRDTSSMFAGCTNLKTATLGNGVTYLGSYSFCLLPNLTTVTFGSATVSLGVYAFQHCDKLEKIVFNGPTIYFNKYSILDCPSLKTIEFNGTVAQWQANINGVSRPVGEIPSDCVVYCTDGNCDVYGNAI